MLDPAKGYRLSVWVAAMFCVIPLGNWREPMPSIWFATTVPGTTARNYSAITNNDQHIEVFAVGDDGNLYWAFQPGGTKGYMLSEFVSLGLPRGGLIPNSQVGLGVNKFVQPAGSVEVFAFTESEIATISQTIPGTQTTFDWSRWEFIGFAPPANDAVPVVARNSDGRLEVFAFGGSIWHIWQNPTPPPTWQNAWRQIMVQPVPNQYVTGGEAGQAVSVALTNPPADWLEAFAMQSPFGSEGAFSGDAQLWHDWQCAAESVDGWIGPIFPSLGAPPISGDIQPMYSTPSVAVNSDGRLEIFVGMTDGNVWHIWQTAPAGASCVIKSSPPWSAWAKLGIPTGVHTTDNLPCPAAILNPKTGFLEVYVVGDDGALFQNSQDPTGPDGWAGWQPFGSPEGFALRLGQTPSLAIDFAQRIWVYLNGTNGWCFYIANQLP